MKEGNSSGAICQVSIFGFFSAVDSDFSEMHREILRLKINICKFMINETKQTNKKPKTY